MAARTKARKRALDILFAAEARNRPAAEALEEELADSLRDKGVRPVNEYTAELVRGVDAHRGELDDLIGTYSQGWSIDRMPAVDRNVLRLGIYELLHVDSIPDAVAVSEALNLVRELSTDESPGFVNGVLGAVARDRENLTA